MQHKRIGRVVREYAANRTIPAIGALIAVLVAVVAAAFFKRKSKPDAAATPESGAGEAAGLGDPGTPRHRTRIADRGDGEPRRPDSGDSATAAPDAATASSAVLPAPHHLRRPIAIRQRADQPATPAPAPIRAMSLSAVSADGTRLHAESFGPFAAPTVVLVPGWTETIGFFEPLTRELLARGFHVICSDLRGQGQSELGRARDQSIERYGEDVEAVLAATCPGRKDVIIAGHSMGGMSIVAWAAEFAAAERVRGAALLNTGMAELAQTSSLLMGLPPSVRAAISDSVILHGRARFVNDATMRALMRYGAFGPDASPDLVHSFTQMATEMSARNRAGAGRTLGTLNLSEALYRLTVPTTIVAGEADRLTPVIHSSRMAEALPNLFELLVLPRAGHVAPLEFPAAVADALTRLAVSVGLDAGLDAGVAASSATAK